MLKIQMPFLFSFAVSKWVISVVCSLITLRFLPLKLLVVFDRFSKVLSRALCLLNLLIILLALVYTAFFEASMNTSLCAPCTNAKVQGFVSSVGLLTLMASSEALGLGLALCTLKAVSETSQIGLVLAILAWRATSNAHRTKPLAFFSVLYFSNMGFSIYCNEEGQKMTQGSIVALCFTSLWLMTIGVLAITHRVLRLLKIRRSFAKCYIRNKPARD